MRIAQLSDTYGIEKRAIDYYTTCGLIPYSIEEGSNYRDYGPDAEAIVKKIMILRGVGMSAKRIDEALHNPSYFTTEVWNKHIAELQKRAEKAQKHYADMIEFATDLRDTGSLALRFSDDLDLKSARVVSRIWSRIAKLFDDDKLLELSDSLPDDVSKISNTVYMFRKSMKKKMKDGLDYSSDETQQVIARFFRRIKEYYGIGVYFVYTILKDETPQTLGIDTLLKEDKEFDYDEFMEVYCVIMKVCAICAEWCREAKSISQIQNFELFKEQYREQIEALDREVDDSTVDVMIEVLNGICSFPQEISGDWVSDVISGIRKGFDAGIEIECENDPKYDAKNDIELENYIFSGIETYADGARFLESNHENENTDQD